MSVLKNVICGSKILYKSTKLSKSEVETMSIGFIVASRLVFLIHSICRVNTYLAPDRDAPWPSWMPRLVFEGKTSPLS